MAILRVRSHMYIHKNIKHKLCTHKHTHTHATHVRTHTHMPHARTHTHHRHAHTPRAHTHTHTHTQACTHTQMQSRTHTHTHTHTQECGYHGEYRDCGVLSMEHLGKTFDGFCLTCVLAASSTELSQDSKYEWAVVTDVTCVERLRVALRGDILGCASFT